LRKTNLFSTGGHLIKGCLSKDAMVKDQPQYFSYLLRFWLAGESDQEVWHASLDDPKSGERLGFPSLEALYAFLIEQTSKIGEHEENEPR
jgi:hypothetical protein